MKALLVRVGIDQAYGGWNAPVDPVSRRFVYVPIPEYPGVTCHASMSRRFGEVIPSLNSFKPDHDFPWRLRNRLMHLDPDFSELTYGDVGSRRGARLRDMTGGDVLVFYASLRPISKCEHKLVYAIIGFYVIERIVPAAQVPKETWHRNAHTRRRRQGATDIVVHARAEKSGKLETCIPFGHWRDRSYRVRPDLLQQWGGLSARDGYVQRSAVPPLLLDPRRFLKWLDRQDVKLTARNFDG